MINEKFTVDCEARNVPVTRNLDVISFLADVGTIGDWNMDGLPTDPLSTQNGILITSSTSFPLLVDPQGQALSWIKNKERNNLPTWNGQNSECGRLVRSKTEGQARILHGRWKEPRHCWR